MPSRCVYCGSGETADVKYPDYIGTGKVDAHGLEVLQPVWIDAVSCQACGETHDVDSPAARLERAERHARIDRDVEDLVGPGFYGE
jgi:hypothetical protein